LFNSRPISLGQKKRSSKYPLSFLIIFIVTINLVQVDPHYRVQMRCHTIVDEAQPFVLYGVEVHSPYSKAIVTKRYNHFAILNA
jgi:hypothetical protein